MSKRALLDDGEGNSPKKKKEAKPLDPKKFGRKTEEEVCQMLLPDHLAPGLDIIFMGINPGLYSAYLGHHYCNANNHFWPCLYESGLIPKKLGFMEDAEVLNYGIGMSNIVPRTTRSANELSRKEIKDWSKVMIERMQELKPLIICFNGKGIYEIYTGGKCTVGIQEDPLPGTDIVVYVMPSTSGRAATYPKRSDKLKFFSELKDLRDRLQREREQRGRGEAAGSIQPANDSNKTSVSSASYEVESSTTGPGSGNTNCTTKESTGGQASSQRVSVIVSTGNHTTATSDGQSSKSQGSGQNHLQTSKAGSSGAVQQTSRDQEDILTQKTSTEDVSIAVRSPYFHQQNS